jgi:uncharacterized protein (DUF2141 family)
MFMKKHLITASALAVVLLSAVPAPPAAAQQTPNCPTINVTGLKANEGVLMLAVYSSSESFFKKPVWVNAQKVSAPTMQIPLCNLDAEEIAITGFQDMNGNEKLDSNPLGIPSEPYAASGTPAMFSAPTWKDTKVALKGVTEPIALKF